ncbi:glycosyltransferase [Pararoseomonas indoligenes]|uniref:Glycosyltransferase n=1 Tax=Roseomonas indoligenes TaxID=2820811 RepID=A0A940N3N2_9PROT|nr:glycosyltransferase [Pararoseomonas indoligenes]MBP0496112.1 glycosyltransferase [Pararoseomonas indoligenes]
MKGPPRRVLHVLKYYRPAFTGEGVFLERSSAVMQELDGTVEHELLVTHTPRPAGPEAAGFCSTLRRVAYLNAAPVSTVLHYARLAWWFLRNLRRYDTVHFRTHADWYFVTYLLTRLAGRRLVLSATLDDSLPVLIGHYRPGLRRLATAGFRLFHAYVGISPRLHEQTRAVAAAPERCHLVPCGVTVPQAAPGMRERLRRSIDAGPDDPVLLFVGGLCARKDPLFLIEAMPAVLARHPGARLVLVGPPLEPDYVRRLDEAVAAAGIGAAVVLAGERLDPHPWFDAADLLVFASRLEGFGTVVPEAMAHGLPVVARRLAGVNESFVLQGETGFLFEDREGYLDAVLRLAGDAAMRRRLGAAGKALCARQFGMRQVAARYLGIYGLGDAGVDPDIDQAAGPEAAESGLGCTASITDSRFHAPADAIGGGPGDGPVLVTMVDAEEAFDWSRPFSRDARDVTSMRSQHLAHRVFSRHGVVPVYLADHPVASQDAGRAPLRELLQDGLCDLGAQLHPWVTPPFTEAVGEANSFAGNLPATVELEKARCLTGALEDAFGIAPRIYRTGRFGVGPRTADVLKQLGYVADSSVSPCWPTAAQRHDPSAWANPPGPYWVDRERTLMEIPVSAALVGRLASHGGRVAPFLFRPGADRLRLAGAAARLGLMERIRLSPEGMTVEEAKRLTRAMLAQGHRVFVLTYHSPSLEPGNTPYVRTAAQRDRFLAWLDEYYAFFREEVGGRNTTWREVRFGAAQAAKPAMAAAS